MAAPSLALREEQASTLVRVRESRHIPTPIPTPGFSFLEAMSEAPRLAMTVGASMHACGLLCAGMGAKALQRYHSGVIVAWCGWRGCSTLPAGAVRRRRRRGVTCPVASTL